MKSWINHVRKKIFIKHMERRFYETVVCKKYQAEKLAKECYANYIESEGIKFGDPRYSWGKTGANDIVDEEVSHWED